MSNSVNLLKNRFALDLSLNEAQFETVSVYPIFVNVILLIFFQFIF